MMKNKRGISAVVATVLIILITVAAVTIIWAAIIPMINNQLSRGTVCLDAMSQISVENKGYTCYNATANMANIQVSYGAIDVGLAGIQVLISEGGNTNSTEVTTNLPGNNEESILTVSHTNSTITGPDTVKVAPMVRVGNSVETCDALAAVELQAC